MVFRRPLLDVRFRFSQMAAAAQPFYYFLVSPVFILVSYFLFFISFLTFFILSQPFYYFLVSPVFILVSYFLFFISFLIIFYFVLFHRIPRREEKRDDDECPVTFLDLPSAPAFPWRQAYRTFREGDDISEGLRRNYLRNLDGPGFMLSTFYRAASRRAIWRRRLRTWASGGIRGKTSRYGLSKNRRMRTVLPLPVVDAAHGSVKVRRGERGEVEKAVAAGFGYVGLRHGLTQAEPSGPVVCPSPFAGLYLDHRHHVHVPAPVPTNL
jgi:hypothetical protein